MSTNTRQVRTFSVRQSLQIAGVASFAVLFLHGIGLYCVHVGIKLPVAGEYLRTVYEVLR